MPVTRISKGELVPGFAVTEIELANGPNAVGVAVKMSVQDVSGSKTP
jgi:hypothetical protein